MIKGFFGVPGVGKTTILTKIAQKELKKKKYKNIYSINFECSGTIHIDYSFLEKYKIKDSLILIDEITMSADNRDFKNFSKGARDFFILHRHLGCDIIYATQNFENVDKKIRDLTAELWYMDKSVLPFFRRFTTAKRIFRCVNINELNSELTMGYRFCNFLEGLFTSNRLIVYRPKYYRYFDTWDELSIKERDNIPVMEKTPYKPRKVLKIWKNMKKIILKKKSPDGQLSYF